MKKLKDIKVDSGFKKLDSSKLSKILGGDDAFNSGSTKTTSGSTCDNVAVCNCNCPIIVKPKPKKPGLED